MRSLLPREHGAYGQLGVALATGLASGHPRIASFLLAAAPIAAFFAHEPVRVLLGHRGTKALRVDGARARTRAVLLIGLASIFAASGLALSREARLPAILLAPVVLVMIAFAVRNQDRTTAGEAVAAIAMAGAGAPVAASAGADWWFIWLAWGVGFVTVTFAVRALTAKEERERHVLTALVFACLALGALLRLEVAAPLGLVALVLVLWRPAVKHVRRVGWGLMVASLATAVALVGR